MGYKLNGFTLIELIITVAIAVMLLALGAKLYTGQASKEQMVESEARVLASFLERARNFAANPESDRAIGYQVHLLNNNTMEILRIESGGTTQLSGGPQRIALANSRLMAPYPNTINFNTYRDQGSGDITQDKTLTTQLNRGTETAQIQITKSGAISVCTPIKPIIPGFVKYQCS